MPSEATTPCDLHTAGHARRLRLAINGIVTAPSGGLEQSTRACKHYGRSQAQAEAVTLTALFGSLPWTPFRPEDWSNFPLDSLERAGAPPGNLPTLKSTFSPDQFGMFYFNPKQAGALCDLHEVAPSLSATDKEPDVKVRVQLLSFHIGEGEAIKDAQRATIRLDIAQADATGRVTDLLCWSAATALDLVGDGKVRAKPPSLQSDISKSFGPRAVEVPGGFGEFRFEVVAHDEPTWWQKIFRAARSPAARSLASTLGFPGIAFNAVELLDEFFNRLSEVNNTPIFQSQPLSLVFHDRAYEENTFGLVDISRPGVLNPGLYILCRHRDFAQFREADPVFYREYGLVVPKQVSFDDVRKPNFGDPFKDVTYAMLAVKASTVNLAPSI